MTNCWSNEKTIKFINAVRICPELWDVELPMYKDRRLKNERWRKIGEKFQCSSVEAYRKYRSLRTYAKNEEKKKKNSATGKQVKWFAYDALSFVLHEDTPPNSEVKNEYIPNVTEALDCDINDNEEEIIETDIADPLLPPVPSQRSRISKKKSKTVDPILDKGQNILEAGENKRNEYSGFAEHIANKLSKYDSYTRAQAEFKIMKVLFECDMGMYRYRTDTQSPDDDSKAGTSQSE